MTAASLSSAPLRSRSKYASDAQVERAFKLARQQGLKPTGLVLGSDGSISIYDQTPDKIEEKPLSALEQRRARKSNEHKNSSRQS